MSEIKRVSRIDMLKCLEAKNLHIKRFAYTHWHGLFKTCWIEKINDNKYYSLSKIRLWVFVLFYPLIFLFDFFTCLWEDGLSCFAIPAKENFDERIVFGGGFNLPSEEKKELEFIRDIFNKY